MDDPGRRASDARRLRKGMYILPSLFTTANLAAGFYAISQTALGAAQAIGLETAPGGGHSPAQYFNHAALAIGFAVFFDGMDGAIARLTHTTSDFGKELDSLADVVTFGVAPGILAWMWGFLCLPLSLNTDLRDKLIEFGGIVAFSLVTETVFQWPGMGLLLVQSVAVADIPVMSAYLLLIALVFVLINLVVDLLYYAVDPRLRARR